MHRRPSLLLACTATLLAGAASVSAQTIPATQVDPAALQHQEQERRRQMEQPPQPATAGEPNVRREAMPEGGRPVAPGPRFVLRTVVFDPSVFLPEAELNAVAAPYLGKTADFATLSAIVEAVNALYLRHGVLTGRAVLPPQKVKDGAVRIELVEARLGKVDTSEVTYSRGGYLASLVTPQPGETLDANALSDRLGRFNRAGPVQLEASLRPGATFGLTDLMLEVREPPRYQARVFANNESSRNIGRNQVGIDAALNGPAGIDDRLSVYVTRSRGATLGSVSYAIPFSYWGGHLSANYNVGATDVVAGPYRALGISGISHSAQFAVVQPIWQRGAWYVDLAASFGHTHSANTAGGAPLSDTSIANQTAGITFGGANDQRSVTAGATVTHASATTVAAAGRDFNVRQYNASLVENAGDRQFVVLRLSAQDTGAVLLAPSLLFQLGGVASVRGYEVGILSGDRGALANLEFHRMFTEALSGFAFYDAGEVRTQGLPNQFARSVGAGLDTQWGRGWRANLTAGRALTTIVPGQPMWRVTGRVSYDL
jgi:hemolysin activation/secretion protein